VPAGDDQFGTVITVKLSEGEGEGSVDVLEGVKGPEVSLVE
jgi:hypothetical protein